MLELILGGVRSGKSRTAETRARDSGRPVTYVATARAGDGEMAERIAEHRRRRPPEWTTVEAPHDLGPVLVDNDRADAFLLVDCLTLWLTNELMDAGADSARTACDELVECLGRLRGHCVLVSNEVGLGVIPMDRVSRDFCDLAGRLHQRLGETCDRVTWVAAGLSLPLKPRT